jgi:hypothetical protein
VDHAFADGPSRDEWLRVAASTAIYVYHCYANPFCGFDCSVTVGPGVSLTTSRTDLSLGAIDFPTRTLGYPDEAR